tara:strand:- start:448 stop:717 length:270 start_codon:yes stop_codon:yes gene_type:complete
MPPKKSKAPKGSHEMPDGSYMKDSDMPKGKKGKAKKVVEDKAPAKKKAPTSKGGDWKGHLKKTFEAGKKKDPKYKYSQAMKDAKKTYKK